MHIYIIYIDEMYGYDVWVCRCMGKPFKVSINYFDLFVLQMVTFCFCLFSKLSLATTTGVDACLCLSFDII